MRQPRVKREPGHPSPESEPGSPHIVASPTSYPPTSSHATTPVLHLPQSSSQNWDESQRSPSQQITIVNQNLLTANTPTNLLTVPQPSYLVKQHSHPLLPSQQSVSGSYLIHRQHSNPEYPGRSSSPSIVIDHAPFIKKEESGHGEGKDAKESGSNVGGLRVRIAELRRSSSSPQVRWVYSKTIEFRVRKSFFFFNCKNTAFSNRLESEVKCDCFRKDRAINGSVIVPYNDPGQLWAAIIVGTR